MSQAISKPIRSDSNAIWGVIPRWVVPATVLLALGVAALWASSAFSSSGSGVNPDYVLKAAYRGPMTISVLDRGELDSQRNATLSSQVDGSTTIVSIVPEGTQVQAPVVAPSEGVITDVDEESSVVKAVTFTGTDGSEEIIEISMGEFTRLIVSKGDKVQAGDMLAADLICELDSSKMRDEMKAQQIKVTNAEAAHLQAKENLAIQEALNESNLSTAELNLKLAKLDLAKYTEGEYLQTKNEIDGEIKLAQEKLARAREDYEFTKRIAKKGYSSQNDLEANRLAVTQAEINLRVATEKRKVLEQYTSKRTVAELESKASELKFEVDRVRRKGRSAITQYEADVNATKLTFEVEESKYERLAQQIKYCLLYAPQAGEVVYSNEEGRRGRSDRIIEKHATVYERQEIVKLPDFGSMKVDAMIHESRISQVSTGQRVQITIDAFPDQIFEGRVSEVSPVPSSTNWLNPGLKEYKTSIEIVNQGEAEGKLRPGLNAAIEIMVRRRDDVLQVPLLSVLTIGGKHYAFVVSGDEAQRRAVTIGESNETAIEILDGIAQGEQVVMNPRTHFADEIAKLEDAAAEESLEGGQPSAGGDKKPSGRPGKPNGQRPPKKA